MNYYQPREMKGPDGNGLGLFHYTCRNDNHIFPVGYCAQDCPGHATEAEAGEHYKAYLLDHRLRYGKQSDQMNKCQVCGVFTDGMAYVGSYTSFILCDEHQTREHVSDVYGAVGWSMSS